MSSPQTHSHTVPGGRGHGLTEKLWAAAAGLPVFRIAPPPPSPLGEAHCVPIQVVELTGVLGDLWLMDLRALHTAAPNPSAAPRLMMTWRFLREG